MPLENSGALLALLGAIPLLLMYFLKPKPREVLIPSLLLIFQLERKEDRFRSFLRRFVRDPLLLIQLAILALLTLSLANPFFLSLEEVEQEHIVLVLDASGSMQATDVFPSRFEAALQEAGKLVSRKDRVSIVLAESVPVVVLEGGTTEEARRVLGLLKPKATATDLGNALLVGKDLLSGDSEKRIVLYSDFSQNRGPDVGVARKIAESEGVTVNYVLLGEGGRNLGITDLRLIRGTPWVGLTNYLPTEERVTLQVSSQNRLITSEDLLLKPEAQEFVQLANLPPGLLTIEVGYSDDLDLDNRAFLYLPPPRKLRTLIVTEERGKTYLEYALESTGRVTIEVAIPPVVPPFEQFDLVVLGRVGRDSLLPGTLQRLGPYVEGGGNLVVVAFEGLPELEELEGTLPVVFLGGTGRAAVRVDLWNELTSDTGLHGLLSRYLLAEPANGSLILAHAGVDESPVFSSRELGKGKVLYFGIPPNESWSDFHLTPAYPLLWNNFVRWIGGEKEAGEYHFRTGDLIPFDEELEVVTPTGRVTTDRLLLDEAGVYRYGDGGILVANFLNGRESNLTVGGAAVEGGEAGKGIQRITREVRRDLRDPLLLLSALLILGEVLFLKRRGEF
jgi:hypothetical protein